MLGFSSRRVARRFWTGALSVPLVLGSIVFLAPTQAGATYTALRVEAWGGVQPVTRP